MTLTVALCNLSLSSKQLSSFSLRYKASIRPLGCAQMAAVDLGAPSCLDIQEAIWDDLAAFEEL